MAMQLGRVIKAPFVTTGNPDTVNDAPASTTTVGAQKDLSGQLGSVLPTSDGKSEYVYVKIDSASTVTPAAKQLLFWKTKATWVVTNKLADSVDGVNGVCGVLRNAATVGNYVWMLRKGVNISVLYGGTASAVVAGDLLVPKAGSTAADTQRVAAGTAATYNKVGVANAADDGAGTVTCDVDVE